MSAYQVLALYESLSTLENTLINKKCKKLNLAAKFMVENNGKDYEKALKFFNLQQEYTVSH